MKCGRKELLMCGSTKPKFVEPFELFGWSSSLRFARLSGTEEKWCGYLNENGSDCEPMSVLRPASRLFGRPIDECHLGSEK
jgi:hypothetical protein